MLQILCTKPALYDFDFKINHSEFTDSSGLDHFVNIASVQKHTGCFVL